MLVPLGAECLVSLVGVCGISVFCELIFVGLVRFHLKKSIETEFSVVWMSDDVVEDVKVHVEGVVSTKMDELYERISGLLSACAKEANVKAESDALKTLLCGIEMRFREEHAALVEAINAHTAATKAQTSLLDALFSEAKTTNEKMDRLCSLTCLEKIEGDVATIANEVMGVDNKMDVISSFVSSVNDHVDDIGLVFEHKANEIQTFGTAFLGNDLEIIRWRIVSKPSRSGQARRVRQSSTTARLTSLPMMGYLTKSRGRRTLRSSGSRRTGMSLVASTTLL